MTYECRCSASGSGGTCPFTTTDAAAMTEHYHVDHCWPQNHPMPHERRIPCMDWSCTRVHEILRTGPTFASFHPAAAV